MSFFADPAINGESTNGLFCLQVDHFWKTCDKGQGNKVQLAKLSSASTSASTLPNRECLSLCVTTCLVLLGVLRSLTRTWSMTFQAFSRLTELTVSATVVSLTRCSSIHRLTTPGPRFRCGISSPFGGSRLVADVQADEGPRDSATVTVTVTVYIRGKVSTQNDFVPMSLLHTHTSRMHSSFNRFGSPLTSSYPISQVLDYCNIKGRPGLDDSLRRYRN